MIAGGLVHFIRTYDPPLIFCFQFSEEIIMVSHPALLDLFTRAQPSYHLALST